MEIPNVLAVSWYPLSILHFFQGISTFPFVNFSKAIPRLRLSSIKTQRPASSLADDELYCRQRRFQGPVGARRGFCHSSLILHVMPPVFTTLLPCTVSRFAEAEESVECCWDTAELLPWLLDTQGRTPRFSHFPASHRLFPDFPTIVFCLPQSGSASLMYRRAGKYCCLFLSSGSGRT